jgi:hypothetical protein
MTSHTLAPGLHHVHVTTCVFRVWTRHWITIHPTGEPPISRSVLPIIRAATLPNRPANLLLFDRQVIFDVEHAWDCGSSGIDELFIHDAVDNSFQCDVSTLDDDMNR